MLIDADFLEEKILLCAAFDIKKPMRVEQGVYIDNDTFTLFVNEAEWNDCYRVEDTALGWKAYGVCDSVEQFLNKYREALSKDARKFAVGFTWLTRESNPDFRPHKHGPYIGNMLAGYEYFRDEIGVDSLFIFHLNEKIA